jgi:hypothetical protein
MRSATTAEFASAASTVNTVGKTAFEILRNTTTGALYYPTGVNPTDAWSVHNRDALVTPV